MPWASTGSGERDRHMRGLAEKIWSVLAPISAACNAAFSSEPAMEVWIPILITGLIAMGAFENYYTGALPGAMMKA